MLIREVTDVAERVLEGGAITFDEAKTFIEADSWPDVLALASQATRIREKFTGKEVDLCALVNAKAGQCAENCGYCAQSAHFDTGLKASKLMDPEAVVAEAVESLAPFKSGTRPQEVKEQALQFMACKGAVKAGETLAPEAIQALLAQLDDLAVSSHCPHGRPLWRLMSYRDIRQSFRR